MKWFTRERPKINRIACPSLIRHFVETGAAFFYVPTEKVFEVAAATGAAPYEISGVEPFSHVGELCSFDAFLARYKLTEPALQRLAITVRDADTARLVLAPQAAGRGVSLGLSAKHQDDHEMLEHAMVVYDGFYAQCRGHEHETHNGTPGPAAP
jgi:hypothetical protein